MDCEILMGRNHVLLMFYNPDPHNLHAVNGCGIKIWITNFKIPYLLVPLTYSGMS